MDIFQGWGLEVARGLMTTVEVALLSLAVGFVWGILCALAQLTSNGVLRAIGRGFMQVVRGTPELLIILVIVILVFGASKLPELARGSGRALRIFKAETKGLNDDDDKTGTDQAERELEARQASEREAFEAKQAAEREAARRDDSA